MDNTSQLAGYITQDMNAHAANGWGGAAFVLELDAGSMYQDGFGNYVAQNPAWFTLFPSLEFDTYLTGGSLGGDAGGSAFQFDIERLDASWAPSADGLCGQTAIAVSPLPMMRKAMVPGVIPGRRRLPLRYHRHHRGWGDDY